MSASTTTQITLISKDGASLLIDRAVISSRSAVIHDMLEDLDEDTTDPIPVSEVEGDILKRVVAWCEHHKDDAPEPQSYLGPKEISAWDKEFINASNEVIFDIILAANFLDIKGLFDLGVKTVANSLKGRTPAEIREKYNIVADLSPEDLEEIKKKNAWAEDRT